mmetsp:Transcript_2821/g.5501  ORF Transcript_2821/g.5501 Transcript_2821/m.5501 type:complete len:260 (+) Transcript_2821:510-1289(+)
MVDGRVEHAIADGLGCDRLHVFRVIESELLRHLAQRDARVGERDVAQACTDDVLPQSHDQTHVAVGGEGVRVFLHGGAESGEVPQPHRLHQLEVGPHRALAGGLAEEATLWDRAEQQLHDSAQLVHRQPEAKSFAARRLRRLTRRLQQAAVRVRVLELQRLDAALVVEEASELAVGRELGEARLGEQLVCLVDHLVVQVVAQQQIEQLRHARGVVMQTCGAVGSQERRSQRVQLAGTLVRPRGEEIDLLREVVEGASIP